MSATYETVLEVRRVTDHDCGNYRIGEIDYGIHMGPFSRLNVTELREARETLSILIHKVSERIGEVLGEFPPATELNQKAPCRP